MKMKKLLIGLLALACVTAGSFGLAGCGDNSAQTSEPTEIKAVYAQYVAYAEAQGQTPLSYETWLSTIKGEKGDKGDQGVGIEKVEYDANGDLLITFTDGRTQTVDVPEKGGQSEGTAGLHYQRIAGKDEYRVIGIGLASEVDIVIPSTYNGLPVTEIAYHAFGEQEYITSVIIPDSVTSIGYGAFDDCDSLTSIEISNSVTGIGDWAFSSCNNLTSVVIGNSVTSIGKWAFQDCSSLTSIEIPDSVTSIGYSAFGYCENLTSIQFKGTVAQWNAIEKGSWGDFPATEVVCSDGKAAL